jgi:ferritin-like metal-binding protein YciE
LYTKSEEKLILKKEELYKRGDVSKWLLPQNEKFDFNNKELAISKMLPNETNNVKNLKMLFYYHATSCKNEFNRMREVIGFQNQEASKLFYSKNSKVIEDLNKAWEIFKSDSN